MKKGTVIFLFIVMFTLSSCGREKKTEIVEKDYSICGENFPISDSIQFTARTFFDDHFLFAVNKGKTKYLASYNYETGELTPIDYAVEEDREVEWIHAGNSGEILLIETSENEEESFLKRLNADGAVLSAVQLDIPAGSGLSYEFSADGYLCAVILEGADKSVWIFNLEGTLLKKLSAPFETVFSLRADASGNVYIACGENHKNYVVPIDFAALSFGKRIELNCFAGNVFPGSMLGGDFCYYDDEYLYEYSISEKKVCQLAYLPDFGILGNNTEMFPSGSSIICLTMDSSGRFSVVRLSQSTDTNGITQLVLASYQPSRELMLQVASFNRTNGQYRISVKDYSEFDTGEEQKHGLAVLNTEIISGKCPDMIDFSNMRTLVEKYERQGLLSDLYTFMDSDIDFNRDMLVEPIAKVLEVDGSLFEAIPSFTIDTVAAPAGINLSFPELLAEARQGKRLFDISDKTALIKTILCNTIDSYIKHDNGKTVFDADDFSSLMEFLYYIENTAYSEEQPPLLYLAGISNLLELQKYEHFLGGKIDFIGYPHVNGSGNKMRVQQSLSICSQSAYQDAAWMFVRTLFSETYQMSQAEGGWLSFPTNKKVMDRMIQDLTEKEYDTVNGVRVERSKGGESSMDDSVKYYAAADSHVKQIYDLMNSLDGINSNDDPELLNIIFECIQPYLTGAKDLENAMEILRSRVQLYLDEQS